MKHTDMVPRWLREPGVEIGAFKTPIPGIKPVYVDRFREFAHEPCLADYLGDACALPFHDQSLNYVASSHVLEHTANPVAALMEWYRVLRPGGIIYCVVPDKRYTWDRRRATTPVAHLFDDYLRGTPPTDGTHVDDFADGVVAEEFYGPLAPAELAARRTEFKGTLQGAVRHGQEINIHFHVFDPASVRALIEQMKQHPATRCRWTLVEFVEQFPDDIPNGILAVIRADKSPADRGRALWRRLFRSRAPGYPLLPSAVKF